MNYIMGNYFRKNPWTGVVRTDIDLNWTTAELKNWNFTLAHDLETFLQRMKYCMCLVLWGRNPICQRGQMSSNWVLKIIFFKLFSRWLFKMHNLEQGEFILNMNIMYQIKYYQIKMSEPHLSTDSITWLERKQNLSEVAKNFECQNGVRSQKSCPDTITT